MKKIIIMFLIFVFCNFSYLYADTNINDIVINKIYSITWNSNAISLETLKKVGIVTDKGKLIEINRECNNIKSITIMYEILDSDIYTVTTIECSDIIKIEELK